MIALSGEDGEAKSEIWSLCALGGIAMADLRAQSHRELFFSDAFEEFTAELSSQLHRHCLARGAWSKLLTPWQSWLKTHGELWEEDELPAGVPLVSRPLWLELAETLQFRLDHRRPYRSRKHINLLELQSILEVEDKLAQRRQDCRYVLGADLEVKLAVICKGRSSSPALNILLRKSLPNLLGSGLYGSYGFAPSLANVADDPTRSEPIRKPKRVPIFDLQASLEGRFSSLDAWFEKVGFTVEGVAGLPFATARTPMRGDVQGFLLDPLRAVQKLQLEAKCTDQFSPFVGSKEQIREHAEPEGQTKNVDKRPQKEAPDARPSQAASFVSERVPPPAERQKKKDVGKKSPVRAPRLARTTAQLWLQT